MTDLLSTPLLQAARRIRAATLFRPGREPEEYPTFDALQARVLRLATDHPGAVVFTPAQVAYPYLDPFRAVSVRVGGELIGFIADTWADDTDRDFALRILRKAVTTLQPAERTAA